MVCHDELFKDSDGCIPAKRPQDTVHCNTDPCPTWSSGEWSSVSFFIRGIKIFIHFWSVVYPGMLMLNVCLDV